MLHVYTTTIYTAPLSIVLSVVSFSGGKSFIVSPLEKGGAGAGATKAFEDAA